MGYPKGEQRYKLDHARKPQGGVKIESSLINEAIIKCRGNISRAADKIGMSRQHLHSRINAEPDLKATVDQCRERFLDDLEDVFQNKALSGDTVSGLFLLKTIGRKRGYDQDRDVAVESATRGALEFIFNKSKNPAES